MPRLRRPLWALALFLLALPPLSPQPYSVTEEQLQQLEQELALQKEELARLRELSDAQETQLDELNRQLETSAAELQGSAKSLAESRQALQEAKESLRKSGGKAVMTAALAGVLSLAGGFALGLVAGLCAK